MKERGIATSIIAIIVIIVVAAAGVGIYFFVLKGSGAFGEAYITGLVDENGNTIVSGGTTDQKVQHIKGTVKNPQPGETTFKGKVYLNFSGVDEEIPVYNDGTHGDETTGDDIWAFYETRVLIRGTNTFRITVKDEAGATVVQSDEFNVTANIPVMDIWIQLTWNTDETDVDLHVWDPNNEHTYWSQLTEAEDGIPGAQLDVDDVNGYGPEHFTMQSAQAGDYVVKVRYFSTHGVTANTTATVRINIAGGAYHTYTHTFAPDDVTTETGYSTTDGYDWHVVTLSMTGTGGGTVTAGT